MRIRLPCRTASRQLRQGRRCLHPQRLGGHRARLAANQLHHEKTHPALGIEFERGFDIRMIQLDVGQGSSRNCLHAARSANVPTGRTLIAKSRSSCSSWGRLTTPMQHSPTFLTTGERSSVLPIMTKVEPPFGGMVGAAHREVNAGLAAPPTSAYDPGQLCRNLSAIC
jgi:hypothetical protein